MIIGRTDIYIMIHTEPHWEGLSTVHSGYVVRDMVLCTETSHDPIKHAAHNGLVLVR